MVQAPEFIEPPIPKHWTYELFRQYLFAMARDELMYLSQAEYPESFDLSQDWHEVLEDMRRKTGVFERWCLAGTKADRQSLHLQTIPVTGGYDTVSSEIIAQEIKKAKEKYITEVLGDIHSHPPRRNVMEGFSPTDLYQLVRWTKEPRKFIVLVFKDSNYFAFPSAETENLPISARPAELATFKKQWSEQYPGDKSLRLNYDIARAYHLVLYKGEKGKPLTQSFPLASPGQISPPRA